MRVHWLIPVVAAAVFGQTHSPISREGAYWVQTSAGTVELSPAGRVWVRAYGPIVLRGADNQDIQYRLTKRVRAREEAEAATLLSRFCVNVRRQGDLIRLVVVHPVNSLASSELELRVPRSLARSVLETRGGSIEATGLDGAVDVSAIGGRIRMDDIGRSVTVRTGGGEIRLGRVGGSLRCFSGGGTIHAERIGGEAFFETAGGEIYIGVAGGPVHALTAGGNIRVQRAAASVTAHTSGGLIDVIQAEGPVKADSASGCIRVASAKGVRLESAGGTIQLRGVSGALRAATASGNILAEIPLNARIEDSNLTTGHGDVTVFIPSNLAVTVQAHNESKGRLGRIVSEFPEIQVRLERFREARPAIAEGALNGGGPRLQISATGGTIYLRRQN
jgi:Putative adhesin